MLLKVASLFWIMICMETMQNLELTTPSHHDGDERNSLIDVRYLFKKQEDVPQPKFVQVLISKVKSSVIFSNMLIFSRST